MVPFSAIVYCQVFCGLPRGVSLLTKTPAPDPYTVFVFVRFMYAIYESDMQSVETIKKPENIHIGVCCFLCSLLLFDCYLFLAYSGLCFLNRN